MAKFEDLTGQTIGRLTILCRAPNKSQRTHWLCQCSCGAQKSIMSKLLKNGHTRSCGCFQLDNTAKIHTTHGLSKTAEYRIWHRMKSRCEDPKDRVYPRYGGRNILVSKDWQSFLNFYRDIGPRPSDNHSIERLDNSLGYSKENCIWATPDIQTRNKRNNRVYDYDGITACMADWARILQVSHSRLAFHLHNKNRSIEEAIAHMRKC